MFSSNSYIMEPQVCNNSARLSFVIKSCMLWDISNQNYERYIYTHKIQKSKRDHREIDATDFIFLHEGMKRRY